MIFAIGEAGFVGSNLALYWRAQGDEPVITFDRLADAGTLNNSTVVHDDPRHLFGRRK
jgi:dTDP-D-glucose 4,6-dehydratase